MSRSYKHTPYCGDSKSRFMKRYANKVVRRQKLMHNFQYSAYKKAFCSWNICDYYTIETRNFEIYYKSRLNQVNKSWFKEIGIPSKEEYWQEYQKWYIRK